MRFIKSPGCILTKVQMELEFESWDVNSEPNPTGTYKWIILIKLTHNELQTFLEIMVRICTRKKRAHCYQLWTAACHSAVVVMRWEETFL